jgi:hypothetical protein
MKTNYVIEACDLLSSMHTSKDFTTEYEKETNPFGFSNSSQSKNLLKALKALNKKQTCTETHQGLNSSPAFQVTCNQCTPKETSELQQSDNIQQCDDHSCNINSSLYIQKESSTKAFQDLKNEICTTYKLNELQKRAFETFLSVEQNEIKSQILMYVGRAVGTGKSQIIKAICEYFKKSHQQYKLKIATFTANASILIDGSTIHLLIGLSIDPNMDSQKIKNTKGDWPNIDYIIFDEISMIGCTMLANMHLKLQI